MGIKLSKHDIEAVRAKKLEIEAELQAEAEGKPIADVRNEHITPEVVMLTCLSQEAFVLEGRILDMLLQNTPDLRFVVHTVKQRVKNIKEQNNALVKILSTRLSDANIDWQQNIAKDMMYLNEFVIFLDPKRRAMLREFARQMLSDQVEERQAQNENTAHGTGENQSPD